jgi:acyl carrier protein
LEQKLIFLFFLKIYFWIFYDKNYFIIQVTKNKDFYTLYKIYMSDTFNQVRKLLNEEFSFHYDQIQLETKLELELGMDSREFFELIDKLELLFKILIDLDDIDKMMKDHIVLTIQDLVNYINQKQHSIN